MIGTSEIVGKEKDMVGGEILLISGSLSPIRSISKGVEATAW